MPNALQEFRHLVTQLFCTTLKLSAAFTPCSRAALQTAGEEPSLDRSEDLLSLAYSARSRCNFGEGSHLWRPSLAALDTHSPLPYLSDSENLFGV